MTKKLYKKARTEYFKLKQKVDIKEEQLDKLMRRQRELEEELRMERKLEEALRRQRELEEELRMERKLEEALRRQRELEDELLKKMAERQQ